MGTQLLLIDVPATGQKISRRKSPKFDRINVNHKIADRRYYLHRRLDKNIFEYDGATRIMYCRYRSIEEIPSKYQRKYLTKLIELGYNVQFKVFNDDELTALRNAPPEDFAKW